MAGDLTLGDLRQSDLKGLFDVLENLKKELMNLRLRGNTSISRKRFLKKQVARVNTIITEKNIK